MRALSEETYYLEVAATTSFATEILFVVQPKFHNW